MYKLKSTSAAAKFYKWIWGTDVTKFKTMCPYFWKYVLTIILLPIILPGKLIIYLMPAKKKIGKGLDYIAESKVGQVTGKTLEKVFTSNKFWNVTGKIFKWIFFIALGAFCLLILVALVISFYLSPVEGLAFIGGVTIALILIGAILYAFGEYNLGSKITGFFKLIGNMFYSLYKSVCPIIKWE